MCGVESEVMFQVTMFQVRKMSQLLFAEMNIPRRMLMCLNATNLALDIGGMRSRLISIS